MIRPAFDPRLLQAIKKLAPPHQRRIFPLECTTCSTPLTLKSAGGFSTALRAAGLAQASATGRTRPAPAYGCADGSTGHAAHASTQNHCLTLPRFMLFFLLKGLPIVGPICFGQKNDP
jgi:hypothetical protein